MLHQKSYESIKAQMLATGTQGAKWLYSASTGIAEHYDWWTANNMLRQAKAGHGSK